MSMRRDDGHAAARVITFLRDQVKAAHTPTVVTVGCISFEPNAINVPRGRLAPDHVVRLLHDVAAACDIVGLAITEYMPWEAIATRNLLRKLPLLGG